jgi:hypothetical protein
MATMYIGFRVEIAGRLLKANNLIKKYNSNHKNTKLFDLFLDGKISIEKDGKMLIARGAKSDKPTNMVNFAAVSAMGTQKKDVDRVVQIVNVLGNDRLIRERVNTFMSGFSNLNNIPELQPMYDVFVDLDSIIPGFAKTAWYYAPEAIIK